MHHRSNLQPAARLTGQVNRIIRFKGDRPRSRTDDQPKRTSPPLESQQSSHGMRDKCHPTTPDHLLTPGGTRHYDTAGMRIGSVRRTHHSNHCGRLDTTRQPAPAEGWPHQVYRPRASTLQSGQATGCDRHSRVTPHR